MSESSRDINHPVWDIYDLYRDSRFSVLYYSEKLNWYKGLNSFIEIVLAITTSSSAVAALWLWNTSLGQEIWKYVLVVSAILAIIKPVIRLTEKVQQYEEVLTGYRSLENDLKIIVIQIKQSKKYGTPHRTKLMEALLRQGELQKKNPEAKPEKKLQDRCRQQVAEELPAEHFFIPKDK
jgi:hypothetical protein